MPISPCGSSPDLPISTSLSSIQLKLMKIGAKIVSHSRMTVFQMAEVAVPEKLFRSMNSPPGEGMREDAGLEFIKDERGRSANTRQDPVTHAAQARIVLE